MHKTLQVLMAAGAVAALTDRPRAADAEPNETKVEVLSRGPNSRVVQRTVREVLPDGSVTERLSKYEEVASGLHHWTSAGPGAKEGEGQWSETEEKFEIFPGGAVAHGQHIVIIGPDLRERGVVDIELGGHRFRSGLLGLAYTDSSVPGKSVLIGEPQACVGELVAPNHCNSPPGFQHPHLRGTLETF